MGRSVNDLIFEGSDHRILKTRKKGTEKDRRDGWDGNGRCVRHPSVIVARRKPFGRGWQKLPGGCRECSDGEKGGGGRGSDGRGADDDSGGGSDGGNGNGRVGGLRSSLTGLGGKSYSSRSGPRGRDGEKEPLTPSSKTDAGSLAHVHRMPYKTPWGEEGVYTGQVTRGGVPHGTGKMRFDDGGKHVGRWSRGYSEVYLREHNSGFFTYFGTRF